MTRTFDPPDTAYFLDEEAAELRRNGERLIHEIEDTEKRLVNLRDQRDKAFRRAAEMTTAANILREIGLRAEMTPNGPLVSVDRQLAPADPTRHPAPEVER